MDEVLKARRAISRPVVDFKGTVSRTKQEFKGEADINNIMRRYAQTGVLVDPLTANGGVPRFGDFSSGEDFRSVVDRINLAEQYFMQLSAADRARFDNDPAKMLDFVNDPANQEEAIKMKLLPDPAAYRETVVEPAGEPAPEPAVPAE